MKHVRLLAMSVVVAALPVQGCATKTYGRQPDLSSAEMELMSCRDIDLESAKVKGFVDHVNRESRFSGRDVLAFFADFGIGNSLEKTAALESAGKRLDQLQEQRYAKKCALLPDEALSLRSAGE